MVKDGQINSILHNETDALALFGGNLSLDKWAEESGRIKGRPLLRDLILLATAKDSLGIVWAKERFIFWTNIDFLNSDYLFVVSLACWHPNEVALLESFIIG